MKKTCNLKEIRNMLALIKWMNSSKRLRVNFHDVVNMNPMPIKAVAKFRRASDRLLVAAFLMICVSSDSLLKSSPVLVTSKKAISCRIIRSQ